MKILLGTAAALLLLGSAATASAQQATGTVTATAVVIQPITITQTQAMDFAKLTMDATANTAGTVVVAAATGNRTATGGVDLVSTGGAAGIVSVVGQASNNYTVSLPVSAVTLTSGANTMTVDTFNSSDTLASINGTNSIHIGATLHAAQAQPAGSYTGSFTVTASYD